jgi:UDP-N-acetylmuramoylalanine--D-glutamate ligase
MGQELSEVQRQSPDFTGVRALVVGLAREGTALTRFLVEHGARVTVTDLQSAAALAQNRKLLSGLPVSFALGEHPKRLLDEADALFVSPGVPLGIPFLREARERQLPLSSETHLFTQLCPAPVMGITGSSGKTTTTVLVGQVCRTAGRRTWVGGNIGRPLIGHLQEIEPTDAVVMELSSFQLEFFSPSIDERGKGKHRKAQDAIFGTPAWSPPIAAVLNITPNHLDRHLSMEAYIAAKAQIMVHQQPEDTVILNLDDPITRQMGETGDIKGRILWFSKEQEVASGAFLQADALVVRLGGRDQAVCRTADLRLLGQHNLANVLAACALAAAAAVPTEAVRQAVTTFRGVDHRLELYREKDGVRWYDDSIATAPERTVAALLAFPDDRIVLMAGGRDKHLPWDEMAALTWKRVAHLVLFGEAADLIEEAMRNAKPSGAQSCQIHHTATLEHAVALAHQVARPGDVVLLSPGGTSFDAYPDFVARGEHFKRLVKALE